MVSTCGSTLRSALRAFSSSVIPFALTGTRLHTSWEFVTTLNYEWRTIRGRQPYRWTIWVCNYRRYWGHRCRPLLMSEPQTDLFLW